MSAFPPPDPLDAFLTNVAAEQRNAPPPPPAFIFRYGPNGILPTPQSLARVRYRQSLDEDSCLSFDEWKACGYFIKKGARSHFTDIDGIPQFTKEQVEKSKWRR